MAEINLRRAALIESLVTNGNLSDKKLIAAFRDVPREVFVPHYFAQSPNKSGWVLINSSDPRWAEEVCSNRWLITQLNGDEALTEKARRGHAVEGISTSSSSMPSLMALMLEALDLRDGMHVLEIGTGTGYNTALLCHRVGARKVASIDVDPILVNNAGERLAALGYLPYLATGDGAIGCAKRAPFDRVIATVALPRLPSEWITQTKVGGIILLPLHKRNCGGLLARLTVHENGIARGHFLPDFGGFMPLRDLDRHDAAEKAFRTINDSQGDTRYTSYSSELITSESNPFHFFAALTIPGGGWNYLTFTPSNGNPVETWLAQQGGSWACHTHTEDGLYAVRQGGPTRLWDCVEAAYNQWRQLGQPTRERFGLTVHDDGQHSIWLDDPDNETLLMETP